MPPRSCLKEVVSDPMPVRFQLHRSIAFLVCALGLIASVPRAETSTLQAESKSGTSEPTDSGQTDQRPSLAELKRTGYQRSRFNLDPESLSVVPGEQRPQANLIEFNSTIKPLLDQHCIECHGPDLMEGNIRIDVLEPDLLRGADTDWWVEIFSVVTKGEMPPPDQAEMPESDRRAITEWLSSELKSASLLRRASGSRSSFRRLTRYEYNYALQDLLGLPWDFAKDLPPEPQSEEGFENSSELLHLSVSQFETYHRLARQALKRATVVGDRPRKLFWGIAMKDAADREWPKQTEQIESLKKKLADDPDKLDAEMKRLEASFCEPHRTAYYQELSTGRTARADWSYGGARYAFAPQENEPQLPPEFDCVAILPPNRRQHPVFELGNQLPDEGTMRVTIRASRVNAEGSRFPSLQLLFGWQASNEGRALMRVSKEDVRVTASPEKPQIIQWDVPLGEIYPRNTVRKTSRMGATPSPSEYIRIANSSASPSDVQIDFVKVEAPVYDQWPPESHRRIFFESDHADAESVYAREILQDFMTRAWRRPVSQEEVDRKLKLFSSIRSRSVRFEEATIEVLATVLSSPQFLYVSHESQLGENAESQSAQTASLNAYELATRLSLFLWCSIPDAELLELAESGDLAKPDVLASQVERLLADPRSQRLDQHFGDQWLNMQLLTFVNLERKVSNFDPLLKEAMQQEPLALFREMRVQNAGVLDFIHSDYSMLNERLARHYGLTDVFGNQFRRVDIDGDFRRGGLLTQAGLLAMNSDWPDSHPLKRAIWLLERLLNDPPPPPPPAVPQIDIADPEIAKMTLKQRLEDHRNHAACMSCHIKIDPWGIAFENYDALGMWRDEIRGELVDASSELFNHQVLDGMDGLKRFLLEHRQDQFVQAIVQKLATFALGRPLGFEDRADVEFITSKVRREGDGLKTIIHTLVQSDLFRSK